MRIAVTGASGMLGTALITQLSLKHKVFATSRSKGLDKNNVEWDCFDLTNFKLLERWLHKIKPEIVIHCAAIINVDFCEQNFDLAKLLNVEVTGVIANYIHVSRKRLIYISTDSVFDGKKIGSYSESDQVNPLNVYAQTKLMGEKLVEKIGNSTIIRTNIVGWTKEGKESFFEWLLNGLISNKPLNLFHDVYFSPLTVDELSIIIEEMIYKSISGLYHCGNCESVSKYDFGIKMSQIFHLSSANIKRVSVDDITLKAKRPKNMSLDVSKVISHLACNDFSVIGTIKLMKKQHEKKNKGRYERN